MLIRRFEKADAQSVSDLIIGTLRISNAKDYPEEILAEVIKRQRPEDVLQRASRAHFYVVAQGEAIIGCGGIGPYGEKQEESRLFSIFVLPEYQGQGIGRKIMETLETDEYFRKAKRIAISASITALAFYKKMGYTYKNGITDMDDEYLYRLEKCR